MHLHELFMHVVLIRSYFLCDYTSSFASVLGSSEVVGKGCFSSLCLDCMCTAIFLYYISIKKNISGQ